MNETIKQLQELVTQLQNTSTQNSSTIGILIGINGSFIAAIVYLALWVRNLQNRNIATRDKIVEIAERSATATERSSNAMDNQNELMKEHTRTINDLHKWLIQHTKHS